MKKYLLTMFVLFCAAGILIAQPANCVNPQAVTIPFTKDGAGELCFVTACMGTSINSWNIVKVEVNGVDYTNKYADGAYNGGQWPAPMNGNYYIYYKGQFAWSHFEMTGACTGATTTPTAVPAVTPTTAPTAIPPVTPTPVQTPTPTAGGTDVATPVATSTPIPSAIPVPPTVWINPASQTVNPGSSVTIEIHANTGTTDIGAFGFEVTYPANMLIFSSIAEITSGLNLTTNSGTAGSIRMAGFNENGIKGSSDIAFIRITFTASPSAFGTAQIGLTVTSFADPSGATIGGVIATGGVITTVTCGDCTSPTPTIEPAATPTAGPTGIIIPSTPAVWISPASQTTSGGMTVTIEIHANTGTDIGAFGFDVTYPSNMFSFGSVAEVVAGLNLTVNSGTPGLMRIAGFNANGIKGSTDISLVRITLTSSISAGGTAQIGLAVTSFADTIGATMAGVTSTGGVVVVACGDCTSPEPTAVPAPTPIPTSDYCDEIAGAVSFSPSSQSVNYGDNVSVEIHAITCTSLLSAFSFTITYPGELLKYVGIEEIATGLNLTLNANTPDTINVAGFNANGVPGSSDLALFRITFSATSSIDNGYALLDIQVQTFLNDNLATIGYPQGVDGAYIQVNPLTSPGPEETPVVLPTYEPTATPAPTVVPGAGEVWIAPQTQSVANGSTCISEVHVNTGNAILAAFGVLVRFDSAILKIAASSDVTAMTTGFISACNINTPGQVNVSGFDVTGKGPSVDIGLFQIRFTAVGNGTSSVNVSVNTLVDTQTIDFVSVKGIGGSITVN